MTRLWLGLGLLFCAGLLAAVVWRRLAGDHGSIDIVIAVIGLAGAVALVWAVGRDSEGR